MINRLPQLLNDDLEISCNLVEKAIIEESLKCIDKQENVLICYPNKSLFYMLVVIAVLHNERKNLVNANPPSRRTSVLIITSKNEALSFLNQLYIDCEAMFDLAQYQHQYFIQKGIFCPIDDPYFARVYWKHILNNCLEEVPKKLPLSIFFPIATGYHTFQTHPRGERNKIGRKDNSQSPVFTITENINVLSNENYYFDYCFIDISSNQKSIENLPKGSVIYSNTPLDDRIYYLQRVLKKQIILDSNILANYVEQKYFGGGINPLNQNNEAVKGVFIERIKADFNDSLITSLIMYKRLKKKKFPPYELKTISNLIFNIIRLPIEAVKFDEIAMTQLYMDSTDDLLKELKESDYRYEDDDFENILVELEDIFNMYKLDTISPKYCRLLEIVMNETRRNKKVGILSSNKVANIGLKEKISDELRIDTDLLEKKGIYFYNKKQVLKGTLQIDCDTLLVPSALYLNDLKPLVNSRTYKNAYILLYEVEQLELRQKLLQLSSIEKVQVEGIKKDSQNLYQYLLNRLGFESLIDKEIKDLNLTDTIEVPAINIASIREKKEFKGTKAKKAFLVRFSDSSEFFIPRKGKLNVVNRKNKRIEKKECTELTLGDEVLFIDNDVRKDIYKVFVNSIGTNNDITESYLLVNKWRELYEDKFISKNMNDEKLYEIMVSNGWDKKTKSILKNWRSGYSFGPRDKNDIEVLGKSLDIDEFLLNSQKYHYAMSIIRVERRIAARILNKIIYSTRKKLDLSEIETLEKYNLDTEHLQQSIKVKKVAYISKDHISVRPSEIGILYEN